MRRWLLPIALLPLLAAAADPPQGELPTSQPEAEEKDLPPPLAWDDFTFGPGRRDHVWRVANRIGGAPPVVVTLSPQEDLQREGRYGLAWLDYFLFEHKLLPMAPGLDDRGHRNGAEQAARLAAAIAEIVRRAPKLGYDPARIVLVGSGWGGEMAALLGTDPSWLEQAGVPFSSVRAVLVFDGYGLDLDRWAAAATPRERKQIDLMLDGAEAARFSPLRQAAAPNAPAFLFFALPDDADTRRDAEALTDALRAGGASAEVKLVKRTRSRSWSTYPGHPRHPDNALLVSFLKEAVGRR